MLSVVVLDRAISYVFVGNVMSLCERFTDDPYV